MGTYHLHAPSHPFPMLRPDLGGPVSFRGTTGNSIFSLISTIEATLFPKFPVLRTHSKWHSRLGTAGEQKVFPNVRSMFPSSRAWPSPYRRTCVPRFPVVTISAVPRCEHALMDPILSPVGNNRCSYEWELVGAHQGEPRLGGPFVAPWRTGILMFPVVGSRSFQTFQRWEREPGGPRISALTLCSHAPNHGRLATIQ